MVENVKKRVYTPSDICELLGLGRVKVYAVSYTHLKDKVIEVT